MSELKVIYHPFFEPDIATLRRSLLIYDSVHPIIPKEANFTPSDRLKRHMASMPNTFIPESPLAGDINMGNDYFMLTSLDKAFAQLSDKHGQSRIKGRLIEADDDSAETFAIDGVASIHAGKVGYSVHGMLEDHKLIYDLRDDGSFLIDGRAANLILSYLAQRMGKRLGMPTISDVEDAYLLSTACDVFEGVENIDAKTVFASAILRLHFPEEIGEMDDLAFRELRQRYQELRESFPIYIKQLQELYSVSENTPPELLIKKLGDVEKRIREGSERIADSATAHSIRKWSLFGLSGVASIGAVLLPSLAFPLTIGGITLQAISTAQQKRTLHGHFDGVRSLALSAREDILKAARLSDFLKIEPLLVE